jgi:hypothetical protein
MPRLTKGSKEAKDKMQHLRSLRKKKGGGVTQEVETAKIEDTPPAKVEVTGTGKRSNSWIKHVQEFAKSNNKSYFEALKDPKLKEGYKK